MRAGFSSPFTSTRTHQRHSRHERVSAGQGRLGLLLHALEDLFASGRGDAGPAAAVVADLLPERQTGFDPAGCAACWAVCQRRGFRRHRGAVEEKCAPTATFAAATPDASPSSAAARVGLATFDPYHGIPDRAECDLGAGRRALDR